VGPPGDVTGSGLAVVGGVFLAYGRPDLEGTAMEGWLLLFALLGAAWLIFRD